MRHVEGSKNHLETAGVTCVLMKGEREDYKRERMNDMRWSSGL